MVRVVSLRRKLMEMDMSEGYFGRFLPEMPKVSWKSIFSDEEDARRVREHHARVKAAARLILSDHEWGWHAMQIVVEDRNVEDRHIAMALLDADVREIDRELARMFLDMTEDEREQALELAERSERARDALAAQAQKMGLYR